MERYATLCLSPPDSQMIADRPFIVPQVPGCAADSFVPDGGLQVPKRNCPKSGPADIRPGADSVSPKRPMDAVLRRPQDGGDISDGSAFPDIQLDQVRFRWPLTSRRTSPLHFQPDGFLVFDPGHENYFTGCINNGMPRHNCLMESTVGLMVRRLNSIMRSFESIMRTLA